MKKGKQLVETQEIKSFFKAQIKAEWWTPSIVEVDYVGADGETHKWLQFEGYASTNDIDRTNDVVLPEAFESSIQEYMNWNPIILLQHNHDEPVGSIIEATIDSKGLFIKWIIKVDRDNLFQSIRTGVIKTMSFWYRINEYDQESKTDENGDTTYYNIIKKLEIFEISVVSVPMNAQAQFKSAKDLLWLSDDDYKKHFEINKKDEYPLLKSINDIMVKTVKEEVKEIKEEATEDMKIEENVEETKEEIIEEVKENVIEEKEENTEEVKEAIEDPKNTETDGWDVVATEETEETTENVETDVDTEVVEENIEKAVDSKEPIEQKSFDEKSKSIDELLTTKANVEDVENLSKSIKEVSDANVELKKSNETLQKENEKSVIAFNWLFEMVERNYKALQRITIDGSMHYAEEPKSKSNPILDTPLASKLRAIKG